MYDEPVFVLNSDIDWASEHCIETLLTAADEHGIVPTAFVTHESVVLKDYVDRDKVSLGLHPNFLPGSSHGETREEVIDHVFRLVPDAVCFRSHSMVDDTHISTAMVKRGIRYDSNLCLYLQPGMVPLHHWSGIPRFPMFWADDIHWYRSGSWNFKDYEDMFFTPGLKSISTHPFMFALNLADNETYTKLKPLIPTLTAEQAAEYRHPGQGTATFILELIEAVAKRGYTFTTLDALYDAYPKETIV